MNQQHHHQPGWTCEECEELIERREKALKDWDNYMFTLCSGDFNAPLQLTGNQIETLFKLYRNTL